MLNFEIDPGQLNRLVRELGGSEKDVARAFNRALTRTAGTLGRMSRKGLKDKLQLRNAKAIRRRLKTLKRKNRANGSRIMLWFGANDLPVSAFKGRPRRTGRGAELRNQDFPGAFVARSRLGKATVFRRVGRKSLPIAEQTVPIREDMQDFLEDELSSEVEAIFFKHFSADLRARTIYGVGQR